jgi:transcriptional regulator
MLIDQFKSKISEKDFEILTMRMNGKTYEEIAEKLGYKNHSGIIKRIKRIAEAYIDFCDENKIDY